MGFLERELERLASAMDATRSEDEFSFLAIAYQALSWSRDPDNVLRPSQAATLQSTARRRESPVESKGNGPQHTGLEEGIQ